MITNKEIEQRIEQLNSRIAILEKTVLQNNQSNTALSTKTKKLSAKEFLLTLSIESDIQKTLALAYCLELLEGMQSFNASDLEKIFRLAKETPPTNINDVVNKNIAKGFLMEAEEKKDNKKAWILTSSGEQHVTQELKRNN